MTALRSIAASILLLLTTAGVASAQTPPPPGMTQEQFDALVSAISKSVVEKLKTEGVAAKPVPDTTPKSRPFSHAGPEAPDELAVFVQQVTTVVKAVPVLGHHIAAVPAALDERARGGRGTGEFLLVLVLAVAGALATEAILRTICGGLRTRIAAGAVPERGLRSLANLGALAFLDGLGVVALWLVGRAEVGLWFSGSAVQDKVAAGVMTAIVYWRLYILVFRIVLRPGLPPARLCEMHDDDARRMYGLLTIIILLAIVLRLGNFILAGLQTPVEAIQACRVIGSPIVFLIFVWMLVRSRDAARQWLTGLGEAAPLFGFIGRNWVALATILVLALAATQTYGAISGRMDVPIAVILTMNLLVGLILFETLLQALVRRLDSQLAGFTPAGTTPRLPDVIARCVRIAVLIGVVVIIAESWVVEVLELVDASAWDQLTRACRTAGIALFTAFVIWELFKYALDSYLDRLPEREPGARGVETRGASIGSRLVTVMPMLRATVAAILFVVAGLIALEAIGVNTTPLLAGMSVLGLALSFGSQTLVRDIVSGIFYLAEDAFRVGEHIECGGSKGTVEGFTLRSIRLRHPNGQVYTIPFGTLGQITNFSRDWASAELKLRFSRATDLEKLRQAADGIGTAMMDIPELKAALMEPFRMQGVADVTDSAMTVSFRFTARPGKADLIQNEAMTRMLQAFPELGIEFAK
ncbi:mechanosensitive ion channel family protein [Vineibacter terrae]|uniref:Mechanosensitive ion channel family protein n=1 Tax=Vineibacter terrae TaxID=2586908 RepID=A0A5C8PPV1_9HYPH|nr:mechanosensitive ion channel family protein [Vineibacter terrae]TXL76750.1 mechanosensitive ion channel family protein [Vineibacter terrae]